MRAQTDRGCRVLHVMQGLLVGGLEKGVLQLVMRSRREGFDDRIVLFDVEWNGTERDLDPGDVPLSFIKRKPGFDRTFSWHLRQLIKDSSACIVHARNDTALFYSALATLGMRRPPGLIATYHNAPTHGTWRARMAAAWAAKQADGVTVVSNELGARLRNTAWVHTSVTVHNGVDCDEYHPTGRKDGIRARLSISDDALLIGHVGRFDPNKRQCDLVDAFGSFGPVSGKNALVFVGEGPLRDEVERHARLSP